MPLHHAVLALLADKPAHGYELKSSFEQAVGDQWGGLNIGHLYQVLDRLSRDGLIESERQAQQVKPDRDHAAAAGTVEQVGVRRAPRREGGSEHREGVRMGAEPREPGGWRGGRHGAHRSPGVWRSRRADTVAWCP